MNYLDKFRPKLTLTKNAAVFLEATYQNATTILEYGSGGSTVVAAQLPGKTIYAVENDPVWLCKLNLFISLLAPASKTICYYVNTGETKEWGIPVDDSCWKNYPNYALSIWLEDFFTQPDVVLIDGRFRVGCFLTCLAMTQSDITILFDDYADRQQYWVVEQFTKPVEIIDRLAVFNVRPNMINSRDLMELFKFIYSPG
ncbi:MAG: hypothetical protein P5698_16465 [Limnospira sp. PMC 1295.21]|uniref:hypothetical protein n=1 Tax=unclassified Limnospira TaxID=2642885 RepID=UPI0028E1509B|nr:MULTISPECIES: hypothetical protein [unclassified Limnospira]MDT9281939.1 hypothetical protein [Limnospira sp. PMC 1293.21]MDT9291555.1 hypothetical protein [Limnospira sp. PMC 1295.21]